MYNISHHTLASLLIAGAALLASCSGESGAESASREIVSPPYSDELTTLHDAIVQAVTQADQTEAAANIAEYWDRQLQIAEGGILVASEDKEARHLFETTQAAWRAWREAEALWAGDVVRGGSLQPQIELITHADLTEKRVNALNLILRPIP
jgi:uncharacterized protein YecT (DUF1311 family)